jgi:hypothetical protein
MHWIIFWVAKPSTTSQAMSCAGASCDAACAWKWKYKMVSFVSTRRPAASSSPAYCVTFLPRQPLGQRDTRLTDAGQILIELSTRMKFSGSENCSGFEFRELVIVRKLTLHNVLRQTNWEMSGQYLDTRRAHGCISQALSLQM